MIKGLIEWIVESFGISKAQIIYKPYTGWPKDVLTPIKRWVTRTITENGYDEIYIGRTSNPEGRISQHERDKGSFDVALIVYETGSSDNARKVERDLIQYYSARPDIVSVLNDAEDSRGGEGESPYYVYVLLR